jgi:hypothetical protein
MKLAIIGYNAKQMTGTVCSVVQETLSKRIFTFHHGRSYGQQICTSRFTLRDYYKNWGYPGSFAFVCRWVHSASANSCPGYSPSLKDHQPFTWLPQLRDPMRTNRRWLQNLLLTVHCNFVLLKLWFCSMWWESICGLTSFSCGTGKYL